MRGILGVSVAIKLVSQEYNWDHLTNSNIPTQPLLTNITRIYIFESFKHIDHFTDLVATTPDPTHRRW
jgi:hypothetical protein